MSLTPALFRPNLIDIARVAAVLRSATPALLFGLRLWAAICLALYVAFWLQLDNAYWAGTSAAVVFQPSLGASLRKAWFRMIGTVVGAAVIVVLTACFIQDRIAFLVGLALWGAACGFVATLLRDSAGYAAALAGITAAVIASDELRAIGGANLDVFMFAITRTSEICIGIICTGLVLAVTDSDGARQRLATQLAAISAEIVGGLACALARSAPPETRPIRCDLVRRITALVPVIDEAIGECSELRRYSSVLEATTGGLFAALSGWQAVAVHLELLRSNDGRGEADIVLGNIPLELRSALTRDGAADWTVDASRMHRACCVAIRALTALPDSTPSLRLLADRTADALIGIQRALSGMVRLTEPTRAIHRPRTTRVQVPDLLPALINAMRIFIVIGVTELFWIATAWPSGTLAITWSAIFVIRFSPTADQAYANAKTRLLGVSLAAPLAAIVKFAVLPGSESFVGLGIALGLVLIPAGALSTVPRQKAMFGAAAAWFIPLVSPENQITYDTQQFYNLALAIIVGAGAATLAFRLLPSLSPAQQANRLLALTLRDLRILTTGPNPPTAGEWRARIYGRLAALPQGAEPLQHEQLMAALLVGTEILRLRRVARRFDQDAELGAALDAFARGDSSVATRLLNRFDRKLAAMSNDRPETWVRIRARGSVLAMSEALALHAAYFDSGAAR